MVAGDAFTGGLARDAGETAGAYAITRGTLALSANYDLTFTGARFTIDPLPPAEQNGSTTLKHLNASPDFTLDWDPEPKLEALGAACSGEGCPSQLATVALLH
nr:MBG domain-containing protein [Caulobacter hibisci]